MNIYNVDIDGEGWNVAASSLKSAVRKAINVEDADRKDYHYFKLDREIKEHSITIKVILLVENATGEMMDKYFDDDEAEDDEVIEGEFVG